MSKTKSNSTRAVQVGSVTIGGGAPVSIQSMTNTPTHDVEATLAQVRRLADAGCELVRVSVPRRRDTSALSEIVAGSPVPIIADVHFQHQRALEAIEAGAAKIRLNPGNIKDPKHVARVLDACRERRVPIRIGVNEGSVVERHDKTLRQAEQDALAGDYRKHLVDLMMDYLEGYVRLFESHSFENIVLAAKSNDARLAIDAYEALAKRFDYPLHLGVTHAGPPETGRIRSIAALAALLAQGIGDTLRISYAADPVLEVLDAKELLWSLRLRERTEPELIACPTCARLEVDLLPLVQQVRERLSAIRVPIKVAVMGCVVNGPGEADDADVALCAGKGRADIYVAGQKRRTVPESDMLTALLEECKIVADSRTQGP
ncbi:MAG: flavodoxin-dependent (E)-4-hydroxy-3-methylbut-2-enyl-diphosphate synthase [Phycisphaerae bacterium]|nr:flavodoxin-dependent (E)-4-hydroxy-3-methylbut-2-enyl-diphosphate synthase [Phycisphaerae bacterium]